VGSAVPGECVNCGPFCGFRLLLAIPPAFLAIAVFHGGCRCGYRMRMSAIQRENFACGSLQLLQPSTARRSPSADDFLIAHAFWSPRVLLLNVFVRFINAALIIKWQLTADTGQPSIENI